MPVTYRPAPAVARVAADLIATHHDHLDGVRIEYVFRSETAKTNGKAIWGKARKITGLNAFLASHDNDDELPIDEETEDFFVIEIAEPVWAILGATERTALVDHELCHLTTEEDKDGDLKLKLRPHDLEEFVAIVRRHGLWRDDVENFAAAVQMVLPEPDAA